MKNGLGRGLISLFGDFEDDDILNNKEEKKEESKPTDSSSNQPTEIDIGLIDRNPNQPRTNFDQTALEELAASIKTHGVIQPIIVNKAGERYTIVAGERRWRASRLAGLKTVPCIVRNYSNQEMSEVSIIENLQRENLNPIESAKAIQSLINEFNLTQDDVADKIGKSRPVVTNTLRLLTLPEQIIALIESNKLSAGHARALLSINDATKQKELAVEIVEKGLTVRDVENMVRFMNLSERPKAPKAEPAQSLELKDFETKLKRILSTKVKIKGNDTRGKIEIEYFSADDLNRIYDILNK